MDILTVIEKSAPQNSDTIKLVLSGAVHGNEKCGTRGIERFLKEYDAGQWPFKQGTVRFLPICNPAAYRAHKRFIDVNLNRIIGDYPKPTTIEEAMAHQIKPHLDWASHVVDLHSYTVDDTPFVFCDTDTPAMLEFTGLAACHHRVIGMHSMIVKQGASQRYMSVNSYALAHGKLSCTVECGQHESENAPHVAYQTILNVLGGLGIIDYTPQKTASTDWQSCYATAIIFKEKAGRFTRPWNNFETVQAGTVIGTYDDGETVIAPHDSIIYLPKDDGPIGAEWFYLATSKPQG